MSSCPDPSPDTSGSPPDFHYSEPFGRGADYGRHVEAGDRDIELLARMALRDEAAMKLFYERHKAMVGRLAFASGLGDADAAELVQETFMRAWNAAPGFRGQSSAATWLRGIVRHLIADHIDAAVRARAVFARPSLAQAEDAPEP